MIPPQTSHVPEEKPGWGGELGRGGKGVGRGGEEVKKIRGSRCPRDGVRKEKPLSLGKGRTGW